MHETWMLHAIEEAKLAEFKGEVPIGAVVVRNNQIIGRGHNVRETESSAVGHAEIIAIMEANRTIGAWRLTDCDLYVTLEPCPMCAGAILQARIRNVYFGAYDAKAGCAGSLLNILEDGRFNHMTSVHAGVLESECSQLLSMFFKRLRKKT